MLPSGDPQRLVNRVPVPVQMTLAFSVVLVIALCMGINAVGTYREVNRTSTLFYEGSIAATEQTRIAQLAFKELLAPQGDAEEGTRMRELLDGARMALEEASSKATDADVKAGLSQIIQSISDAGIREEIFKPETLQGLDARLQEIADAQSFAVFQQRTQIDQQAARAHDLIVLTILPMVLVGLIIPLLLARSVTDSLARMSVLVRSIESDQQADSVSAEGNGEFATLTRDILSMRMVVVRRGAEAAEQRARFEAERARLAREQQENETAAERQRSAERRAHRERVAADFELQVASIVETVARTAQELASTASSMTESASNTTQCSRDASSVAEQTSGTASAIAAGTAELSNSAQTVRENAHTSQARALLAVQEAAAAKEQIDHLVAAARQIGSITDTIAGITRQTNLLAINARVEAARAGEFGRGFSIVANEVKALANQTSQATNGIGEQIEQVNLAVARSSQSLQRLRQVIEDVEKTADTIYQATDAQFASTRSIADRVAQISASTASVAKNIRNAESTASRTEEMSAEVTTAAQIMGEEAVRLREQVAQFVLQLRGGDAVAAQIQTKVEAASLQHRSARSDEAMRAIA
jgi:methyl-accepting chemotaxis protein